MTSLAIELYSIADDLRQAVKAGRPYELDQLDTLSVFVTALARLARVDEAELAVHRLHEAGKNGRAVIEQLASESLVDLSLITETEKVVRLDFGGKKK